MKRAKFLVHFSREHHNGLLHVWILRRGIKNNIPVEKMLNYINWFYGKFLLPHFCQEETDLMPLLETGHPLLSKMLTDHLQLKAYIPILNSTPSENTLISYLNLLESHIRFEEREFFQFLQSQYPETHSNPMKMPAALKPNLAT